MISRFIRLVAAFSLLACASVAESQAPADEFTLEQVLSAPFPSDLVVASGVNRAAWVFNARGARNVWSVDPPDGAAHAVTAYAEDDGQEISDVQFTPDGNSLVFVRGAGANRRGEHPNPASSPEAIEQSIFVVPAAGGGAPRKLADGGAPRVSPRGDVVAYVAKDQVWFVPLAGEGKPAQAFHARGECGHLRWSPDGRALAFVSRRGDHSFVGVFEPESRKLRYLDAGVDRDDSPVWSPDGARVAFLRVAASSATEGFRPHREGEPWSIRVADAATGAGREVFRAEHGRGSVFRAIVADDQLFWADGDRIVFPWERDGWTHLYAVPASGGSSSLLTPGEFEVEYVSQSPDRKRLVYNSNQDDVERRHLWSVSPAGGRPIAITGGEGIEWEPRTLADGKSFVFLRSDAKKPPRPAVQSGSGSAKDLAPAAIPRDFPEAALVRPEPVAFSAADGMRIRGQLFLPRGLRSSERRPAAIFFHGGSRRQMLLGWHYNYYYRNSYAFNQYLASRGYVVLSVNYRSGIGYGMEFREALDYGATGVSEFRDVVGAGLYLRSRPDVDPARIALWGGSYGGYLTALGLARASDLFAAGVDFHGVHDWNNVIRNFEPNYDPEKRRDAARIAFESSPLASVETWRSPVLLIHGDDDRNVPFGETVLLTEALRARRVELEELVFPDEIHDFLMHAHWLRAYHAAAEFLDRHLRR